MTDNTEETEGLLDPIELGEGCIPLFVIGGVSYLDTDGTKRWKVLARGTADITASLGLLARVQHKVNIVADGQDLS